MGWPDLASRALKTVRWTVFTRRDVGRRARAVQIRPMFSRRRLLQIKRCNPLRGCILVGPAGFEPTQWRSQSPLHNAHFSSTSRYLFFQGRSFSRSYDSICQKSFSCTLPNVTFSKVLSTGYALLKHASQHDPPSHHLMYDCLCQKEELPPSRQESPYELSTNTSLLLTSPHATSTHYVFPYYKGKLIHRAEQYAIYIT